LQVGIGAAGAKRLKGAGDGGAVGRNESRGIVFSALPSPRLRERGAGGRAGLVPSDKEVLSMHSRRVSEGRIVPLRSALDWLLDQQWSGEGGWQGGGMAPSLDMRETEDAFLVELEMPGVRPEDTEVTLDGRVLIVRGESGNGGEEETSRGRYLVRERQSMSFARAITLPTDVEADRVDCRFENGELMITLPKAAQARSRRIPISTGSQGAKQVGGGQEQGAGEAQGERQQRPPESKGKQEDASPALKESD
jgi:HSP20 family protein